MLFLRISIELDQEQQIHAHSVRIREFVQMIECRLWIGFSLSGIQLLAILSS